MVTDMNAHAATRTQTTRSRAPGRPGRHPVPAVLLALLLGVGAACTEQSAPTGDPGPAAAIVAARALLDSVMEAEAIPGLSVAVGMGSQVMWSEGFGFADLTHGVTVTPLTKFRVGSVSKPITAAAIGVLLEEGALDLDAPVQTYVPLFPEKRYPVTTRKLAGHIGGMRHYQGAENLSSVRYPTVAAGLAIFQDDPLINEPGTEYSYSSYGWNLISAVIEGASGEPFLEYMDRVVFEPLGMRHTIAGHTDLIIPHRTRFYSTTAQGEVVNTPFVVNAPFVDNSYKWAGGGFLSTPEDLLIFANAHLSAGFLEAETLELLFASQRLRSGEETGYGIGWGTSTNDRGERIISHTGGSVGGRTVLTANRDTGVIVAIVANLSSAPMSTSLAARVEEIFR